MPDPPHPLREPVPSLRISIISLRLIHHDESESSLGGQGFSADIEVAFALGFTLEDPSSSSVSRGTRYSPFNGASSSIRNFLEDRYERYTQKFFAGRCPAGRRVVWLEPAGDCAGHYVDRWQARQNLQCPSSLPTCPISLSRWTAPSKYFV